MIATLSPKRCWSRCCLGYRDCCNTTAEEVRCRHTFDFGARRGSIRQTAECSLAFRQQQAPECVPAELDVYAHVGAPDLGPTTLMSSLLSRSCAVCRYSHICFVRPLAVARETPMADKQRDASCGKRPNKEVTLKTHMRVSVDAQQCRDESSDNV